jgi:transmembrane sensor
MTEDSETPKRPGHLRGEASEWFAIMRGPDADARREEFEAWLARGALHRTAYNRIAETFSLGKGLNESEADEAGPAPDTSGQRRGRPKVAGIALGMVGVAAVLYVAVAVIPGHVEPGRPNLATGGGSTQRQLSKQLKSEPGEIREVRLTDGSRVTLDTDSVVETKFGEAQRDVRMVRGRARFTVEHDRRPFVVTAANGTITALGTVFDVAVTRDEQVTIELLDGAVDVRFRPDGSSVNRPVRLAPGQQMIFKAEKAASPIQVTNTLVTDRRWPEGIREYDGVRLGHVVSEANTYATGPILMAAANVADRKVSGTYRIREVERLAENLADMLRLALIRSGNRLILSPACPLPQKENCTPPS